MQNLMANFSCDHEGEVPVVRTEAENTLKKLLDKQLCTKGRLEQVDFHEATESMLCIGHSSSGVASLSEFLQNEVVQKQLVEKTRFLRSILHAKGYSKDEVEERCQKINQTDDLASTICDKGIKRKRYGAHPSFVSHAESEEREIAALLNEYAVEDKIKADAGKKSFGRHARELEASLLRGKDRLKAIAHLSAGGSACRKPLAGTPEQGEFYIGMTPQDRARSIAEHQGSRSAGDVFSRRAPEVLDLCTYLDQRPETRTSTSSSSPLDTPKRNLVESQSAPLSIQDGNSELGAVEEISEQEILHNRLSQEEIMQLPCGKFVNYSPGNPSRV